MLLIAFVAITIALNSNVVVGSSSKDVPVSI
jgi:hypothetical protein